MVEDCNPPLTGRTRFRSTWIGRLVLQVQYVERELSTEGPTFDIVRLPWRDADARDLGVLTSLAFATAPNIQFNNSGAPITGEEIPMGGLPGERKSH